MKNPEPSGAKILANIANTRSALSGIEYGQALAEAAQDHPGLLAPASDESMRWPNSEVLSQLMAERAVEQSIPVAQALAQIKREYPKLAEAADLEVTGRRRQSLPAGASDGPTGQNIGGNMAKESNGAFGPIREQPVNQRLLEMAKARMQRDNIGISAALAQIKNENPRLGEAAELEVTGDRNADGLAPNFLRLVRRALEIAKEKGYSFEQALEQASVGNPELAAAARAEHGGTLYYSDYRLGPGRGDTQVLMAEGIDAAMDPNQHLARLARQRAREMTMPYRQALSEIAREHPALARAAEEQALGRKLG